MKNIVFIVLLMCVVVQAQEQIYNSKIPDSLQEKSYFKLYELFFEHYKKSPKKALAYANAYLEKGKKEDKKIIIAHGYFLVSHIYQGQETYLKYADSIINLEENSTSNEYPARGYLLRANYFYNKNLFAEAFENYQMANSYTVRRPNASVRYHSNRIVGRLKSRVGKHKRARAILRDCYKYAVKNDIDLQHEDLLHLIKAYNKEQNFEEALKYVQQGIEEAEATKNDDLYYKLMLSSGITHYYQKEYNKAIDSLAKSRLYLEDTAGLQDLVDLYYYLGKAYTIINQKEKGIDFLKKMDSVVQLQKDILPEMMDGYTILQEYFNEQKNAEAFTLYTKKKARIDSVTRHNFTDTLAKEIEDYYIYWIVTRRDARISRQSDELVQWKIIFMVSVLFWIIFVSVIIYLIKDRKRYQKSFRAIVSHTNQTEDVTPELKEEKEKKLNDLKISQEVIDRVLQGMENFERNKRYLDNKYSLGVLAKELQTNSAYLSKIINVSKGKNFSNYLHDLRIGYAIERLKNDRQFRLYSIKGISEDIGFNNSESFSKAFHKKTGLYPSSFINKLKQVE
ncbi:helix-turn-helix domain-containing protein [Aquimarina sp. AU474]|uniref:helix-turn-helix domain-containing protein n=1 Tax=Aquimarina sp. AU474 TaxID=2108529 RepID=UPI000D68815E|nr:helix-turn-helix domain-containing protein [Aquimarina sp. AU474]